MSAFAKQAINLVLTAAVLLGVSLPAEAQQRVASGLKNGLPPTTMDSFVYEAGGHAEHIYGDEGVNGLPPYMGFNKAHRINAGIMDRRDAGLTTGHGSYMPDASGNDEFIAPPGEWGQSGARGHSSASGFADDGLPVVNGGGNSGGNPADYGPPPGEGYQPATTCEGFVGWYSPEEVALSQTDFPAAFEHFVYSGRYTGSWQNAMMILTLQMGRPQPGYGG
ncbi:hypothetical protein KBI23_25025 [bacterium]|nr:hypothetical protein [bacterium]MBP9811556.1 hypothetical protein [bacterium]